MSLARKGKEKRKRKKKKKESGLVGVLTGVRGKWRPPRS